MWNRYRRVAFPSGARIPTGQHVRQNLVVQYNENLMEYSRVEDVNKYVEIAESHVYSPIKLYTGGVESRNYSEDKNSKADRRICRAYFSLNDGGLYDITGQRSSLGLSVPRINSVQAHHFSSTGTSTNASSKKDDILEVKQDMTSTPDTTNSTTTETTTTEATTTDNTTPKEDEKFKFKLWHLGIIYLSVYAGCWVYGKYMDNVTSLLPSFNTDPTSDELFQKLQSHELSPSELTSYQLSACISYLRYRKISLDPLISELLKNSQLKSMHQVISTTYGTTVNMLEVCEKELKTRLIKTTLEYQLRPTEQCERALEEMIAYTKTAVEAENNEYKQVITKLQAVTEAADDNGATTLSSSSPNRHIQAGIAYAVALRKELLNNLPSITYSQPSRVVNYFNWFMHGSWDHSIAIEPKPHYSSQDKHIITMIDKINQIINDLEQARS